MIELNSVGKRFGGTTALKDVSLTLPGAEVLAVAGPNGAGKSTLLDVLTGFLLPDDGQIRIGGSQSSGVPLTRSRGWASFAPSSRCDSFVI